MAPSITKLGAVLLALVSSTLAKSGNLKVSTSSGTVLGKIDPQYPHVRQFLGVPYAQPPVGDLRWEPPQALSNSHQTINATRIPPSCPQNPSTGTSIWTVDGYDFLTYGEKDEDCLTVSVWAPSEIKEPLPVYIWIYGGSWQSGGANVPYQIPLEWIESSQAHIVVEVNYRLNIFGFPGSAALEQNNFGLLDQRFGIEWIQKNIAQFGGDPDRMVLWGQSAGAGSVDIQNYAYPDDPIVQGFVADSGTVFLLIRSDTTTSFEKVAAGFNCSSTDPSAELACLKKVPWQDIEDYLSVTSGLSFNPFIDDKIVFSNYTDRLLQGKVSNRPAVYGSNEREGYAVASYPADPATTAPDAASAEYYTNYDFLCPIPYSAALRSKLGLTTYQYEYSGNFSNISPDWWAGAYHSTELPLIFGTDDLTGPSTKFEIQTRQTMQAFWLDFVQNTHSPKKWVPYSKGQLQLFGGQDAHGKDDTVQYVPLAYVNGVCNSTVLDSIRDGTNYF